MIKEVTGFEYNGKIYPTIEKAKQAENRNKNFAIFELSMPNRGSWDGGWSGAENTYTVKKKLHKDKLHLIGESFYYNFGDGWGASVKCRKPEPREKPTNKFCGYEWMIYSILKHGDIRI